MLWRPLGRSRYSWIQALLNHWKTGQKGEKKNKKKNQVTCALGFLKMVRAKKNSIFKDWDECCKPWWPVKVFVVVSRLVGPSQMNCSWCIINRSHSFLAAAAGTRFIHLIRACTCIMDEDRFCTVGNNPGSVFSAGKNKISSFISLSTR